MTPQTELESHQDPQPGKSTGPTTPEGKDRSRLNALRHGLSGQTVLMPWEDHEAYESHCAAILVGLAPVGDVETQFAQGVADDQWRLNRARAVDTNMFALGQFDYAPETGHSQIDAALNSARAFRDHSKVFVNLSLYEQRINRSLEKNFDRLEALQQARRQQEQNRLLEEGMARAAQIQQKVFAARNARAGQTEPAPTPITTPITPAAPADQFVYASPALPLPHDPANSPSAHPNPAGTQKKAA